MPNGGTATFTLARISLHRRGIREPGPRLGGSDANDARSTTYPKMTHFSGSSEPFARRDWAGDPRYLKANEPDPFPCHAETRSLLAGVDGPNHSVASWTLA